MPRYKVILEMEIELTNLAPKPIADAAARLLQYSFSDDRNKVISAVVKDIIKVEEE